MTVLFFNGNKSDSITPPVASESVTEVDTHPVDEDQSDEQITEESSESVEQTIEDQVFDTTEKQEQPTTTPKSE